MRHLPKVDRKKFVYEKKYMSKYLYQNQISFNKLE